jgi:hypothetical protein
LTLPLSRQKTALRDTSISSLLLKTIVKINKKMKPTNIF